MKKKGRSMPEKNSLSKLASSERNFLIEKKTSTFFFSSSLKKMETYQDQVFMLPEFVQVTPSKAN